MRDLRDTLRLLARTGSVMETAEALFVHRNTVAYRLKRAQELLGRDPLTISLSLHAALVLEPLLHWD
ncbi:MAG TPA: helix-turn-helix domain-containing protein [Nakamurella sp.]